MNFKAKVVRTAVTAGLALVMTTGVAFASIGTGTVTADSLRLRSAASTSSSTLAQAPKGSTVTVEENMGNGWYKVTYGSKIGYMSSEWLNVVPVDTAAVVPAGTAAAGPIGTAVVTADSLRLRSEASTGASTLAQASKGSTVTVEEDAGNGWYKVTYGGKTGYMSGEWLTISLNNGDVIPAAQGTKASQPRGLITTSVLNVRSGAGTTYDKVGTLRAGTVVDIIADVGNGWYQIDSGYISADYVTLVGADYESSSALGASAAAMAKSLLGCRYVSGGAGPSVFDCSGLMYYIYKQLGHPIARGSSSQYYNSGYFVSTSAMQPGDLIFFFDSRFDGSGGTLPTTHVGMYVGNGQFIHASTTSYRVQYDSVSGYYSRYIVGAKRIG